MTNKNKLQDTFAETCDKLNDAYVYCQKELDRLRDDNNNLRLDALYYKTLLKECREFYQKMYSLNIINSCSLPVYGDLKKRINKVLGEDK